MSVEPLTHPDQITVTWLQTLLAAAQALPTGQIIAIEKTVEQPFLAVTCRVALTYSEDAPPDAPRHLFIKMTNPATFAKFPQVGADEVAFYAALPADHALPVPRCYGATYRMDRGFHMVLTDYSATHAPAEIGFPPPVVHTQKAIDALAVVHAHFWQTSTDQPVALLGVTWADYQAFADYLGDWLPPDRQQIFAHIFAAEGHLQSLLDTHSHPTRIHGDAHSWNFLYPRAAADDALLVDWDTYHTDLGVFDLAYMLSLWWYPHQRQRFEQALLRRYHTQLQAHGVTDYAWEQCWQDYRLCVIRVLLRCVDWHKRGDLPSVLWWERLEKGLLAFDDLHCGDLLPS